MKKFTLLLLMAFYSSSFGQVDLVGGMGIIFINNYSLADYINTNIPSPEKVGTFSSALELYCEADYSLLPNIELGAEIAYTLFSYNTNIAGITNYNISYNHYKPSVLAYYVLSGYGYKLKLGGGLGPRFLYLEEKIITTSSYSTNGFGVLLRAQGHTLLSDDLYANIGSTLRYDFPGAPIKGSKKLFNSVLDKEVNINSLSISVNIGISYFF
ncbi:MAG: hypothetical protein KKG93_02960 [Bacteroidetes bacterium]|nr:hypothetical protein [Bacteroidota bacterium]